MLQSRRVKHGLHVKGLLRRTYFKNESENMVALVVLSSFFVGTRLQNKNNQLCAPCLFCTDVVLYCAYLTVDYD